MFAMYRFSGTDKLLGFFWQKPGYSRHNKYHRIERLQGRKAFLQVRTPYVCMYVYMRSMGS